MEEKFYSNIGKTLKKGSLLFGGFGLFCMALGGLGILTIFLDDDFIAPAVVLLISGLVLFGYSLWMYGFAQLIDNSDLMLKKQDLIYYELRKLTADKTAMDREKTILKQDVKPVVQPPVQPVIAPEKKVEIVEPIIMDKINEPEDESTWFLCPNCKERLDLMGFTQEDLQNGEKCPICGKGV